VTGVQTCALPISTHGVDRELGRGGVLLESEEHLHLQAAVGRELPVLGERLGFPIAATFPRRIRFPETIESVGKLVAGLLSTLFLSSRILMFLALDLWVLTQCSATLPRRFAAIFVRARVAEICRDRRQLAAICRRIL